MAMVRFQLQLLLNSRLPSLSMTKNKNLACAIFQSFIFTCLCIYIYFFVFALPVCKNSEIIFKGFRQSIYVDKISRKLKTKIENRFCFFQFHILNVYLKSFLPISNHLATLFSVQKFLNFLKKSKLQIIHEIIVVSEKVF